MVSPSDACPKPAKSNDSNTANNATTESFRSAIAGAFAGAFSKTATAPIERVKLLTQLRDSSSKPSIWKVIKDVYWEEGILSFWRGNTPSVIQKASNSALNFMLMDRYKLTISQLLSRWHPSSDNLRWHSTANSLLSAGLAGGTTTTLLYPMEFLRTRLAVDEVSSYRGSGIRRIRMQDVVFQVLRSDGIRGVYQGFGTSIWYVALHRIFYLGGFDVAKTELLHLKGRNDLTMTERIWLAQSVSLLSGAVIYPLDTVRRRLMMQAGRSLNDRQYRNWSDCVIQVWRAEGFYGFFRGLGPHLVKTVGGALLLVAYDSFKSAI